MDKKTYFCYLNHELIHPITQSKEKKKNLSVKRIANILIIFSVLISVPKMYFVSKEYTVNESSKVINVPVLRSGDLSYESSVICYTRQNTAQVMMDFSERPMTNLSRITFKNGEQVC